MVTLHWECLDENGEVMMSSFLGCVKKELQSCFEALAHAPSTLELAAWGHWATVGTAVE